MLTHFFSESREWDAGALLHAAGAAVRGRGGCRWRWRRGAVSRVLWDFLRDEIRGWQHQQGCHRVQKGDWTCFFCPMICWEIENQLVYVSILLQIPVTLCGDRSCAPVPGERQCHDKVSSTSWSGSWFTLNPSLNSHDDIKSFRDSRSSHNVCSKDVGNNNKRLWVIKRGFNLVNFNQDLIVLTSAISLCDPPR